MPLRMRLSWAPWVRWTPCCGLLKRQRHLRCGVGWSVQVGTLLGAYPGIARTARQIDAKAVVAPQMRGYIFKLDNGRYLDPTDSAGSVTNWPGPGTPWPLPIDPTMAYVNEPQTGGTGCNACFEDGPGVRDIHFVAAVDIAAGEEIFIDYGSFYDRSDYGHTQ